MRNDFLLINETEIKQNSVVGDNLDAKYIAPCIVAVQDVYLEPLIGSKLLQRLGAMIDENTIEENPIYKELLNTYIQPFLLNKVVSEICVQIFAKIRNAGVVKFTDSQQNNMDLQGVNFIRKHYEDLALVYGERMIEFLNKNRRSIPEYNAVCPLNGGDVNPSGKDGQNYCTIHF